MRPKAPLEFQFALESIRAQVARSQLLPREYARYRPLLADGLKFFLERLSRARLEQILTEQMALPSSVSTAQRLVTLLHQIPALHKLGQVVARDRRLSPGFRRHLQQLESIEPRTPRSVVEEVLRHELGRSKTDRFHLAPAALAEGSVAVVIRFHTSPGRGRGSGHREPAQGLFKLLKPGISRRLEEDLAILGALGDFLDGDADRYHLPHLDYRETFETIRDLLVHEVRLDQEQQHLQEAADIYRHTAGVKIPALLPGCTPGLTAMEFIEGIKITRRARVIKTCAPDLAGAAVRALIAKPMFSKERNALFHADPHAGNLMATTAGELGIIDWALTGRLRKEERVEMVQLMLSAAALDRVRVCRAVEALARNRPPAPAVQEIVANHLENLRCQLVPGLSWLTRLLDDLALRGRVRFSPHLLLFRKVLLTLEGVVGDLTGEAGDFIDRTVMAAFVREWACEWPARLLLPPNSRVLGTHLSTDDIVSLLWLTPRFWGS